MASSLRRVAEKAKRVLGLDVRVFYRTSPIPSDRWLRYNSYVRPSGKRTRRVLRAGGLRYVDNSAGRVAAPPRVPRGSSAGATPRRRSWIFRGRVAARAELTAAAVQRCKKVAESIVVSRRYAAKQKKLEANRTFFARLREGKGWTSPLKNEAPLFAPERKLPRAGRDAAAAAAWIFRGGHGPRHRPIEWEDLVSAPDGEDEYGGLAASASSGVASTPLAGSSEDGSRHRRRLDLPKTGRGTAAGCHVDIPCTGHDAVGLVNAASVSAFVAAGHEVIDVGPMLGLRIDAHPGSVTGKNDALHFCMPVPASFDESRRGPSSGGGRGTAAGATWTFRGAGRGATAGAT